MIDWNGVLYDPLYARFGVEAELAGETVTVIDETAGIRFDQQGVMLPTIKPAAAIRASTLTEKGWTPADLKQAILLLNGSTWTVYNVHPKPGADGKGSGEYYLVLMDGSV